MDLVSGFPYSLVKNEVTFETSKLKSDEEHDVVIIGAGITGVLVAQALTERGIDVCLVDKRFPGIGSTIASTALIQYEIDVPLFKLTEKIGEENAVTAYKLCVDSIDELKEIIDSSKADSDFNFTSSLFLAAGRKGRKIIEKEFEIRNKYNLPAELLSSKDLKNEFGINRKGAIHVNKAATIDPYRTTRGILKHLKEKYNIPVYSHTNIQSVKQNKNHYLLKTEEGIELKANKIICAAGYKAGQFLPIKVMNLISTYAFVTSQVPEEKFWKDKVLLWETADPYLYIRPTEDNRIIVGGEDIEFKNPTLRDSLINKKTKTLKKKFNKLFPEIEIDVDFSWAGTFSSTEDGLPFIGEYPGMKNFYFALGYGGNGITFSVLAGKILSNQISGNKKSYHSIFGFER